MWEKFAEGQKILLNRREKIQRPAPYREKNETIEEQIYNTLDSILGEGAPQRKELLDAIQKANSFEDIQRYITDKREIIGANGEKYSSQVLNSYLNLASYRFGNDFERLKNTNDFKRYMGEIGTSTESPAIEKTVEAERKKHPMEKTLESILDGDDGQNLREIMVGAEKWNDVKKGVRKLKIINGIDGKRYSAADVNMLIDMARRRIPLDQFKMTSFYEKMMGDYPEKKETVDVEQKYAEKKVAQKFEPIDYYPGFGQKETIMRKRKSKYNKTKRTAENMLAGR